MKTRPVNVLFTHSLDSKEQDDLRQAHIQALIFPLLKTRLFPVKNYAHTIPKNGRAWVFTSKKAVFAIKLMPPQDLSHIVAFAVGAATAQELQELGFKDVLVGQNDSLDLAHLIAEFGIREVVHFCGEFHRPELEEALHQHRVIVHKVICYATEKVRLPIAIDSVSGISVSSPRGVEALHESRPILLSSVILFAIGQTTADAVRKYFPEHPLIVAEAPTKRVHTDTIIHHFLA